MLSRTSPHVGHPLIHQLFWILFVIAALVAFAYVGTEVIGELGASFSKKFAPVAGVGGQ